MLFKNSKANIYDQFLTLQRDTANLHADSIISCIFQAFEPQRIALASSFSIEDQVLTHMLVQRNPKCRFFTIDTGRLFQSTYDVWQRSVEEWEISYEVYAPDPEELQKLTSSSGPNLFYENIDNRKACCAVRKTHPLQKMLSTVDCWICGLREKQSVTRTGINAVDWDEVFGICKANPLYNWSENQIWQYIEKHKIPYSKLYSLGYRSIGCEPCTCAIKDGDDIRAGRWWWELPEQKECGLHKRLSPKV